MWYKSLAIDNQILGNGVPILVTYYCNDNKEIECS
jgi:hypothetical protein